MRQVVRRLIPATFEDPLGLTVRLLRSRNRDALFAMRATALALLAAPLDRLLRPFEERLYARAAPPRRPIIFVTGPPRSGTTLLSQVLIAHLPVTYFNNLSLLFPRAPILANRLFRRALGPPPARYTSYYGWTRGFTTPGSCLHLWDRWMGPDRYAVPTSLDDDTADSMRRFFGAYETEDGKPILNKSNPLATCAALIARTLPTAHFVFVTRAPAFTVQSILGAREAIQGARDRPYGVQDPTRSPPAERDGIEEVCAQVLYHERVMQAQQRAIGAPRCRTVRYEEFCRTPHEVVAAIGREVLGVTIDAERVRRALPPFRTTNRMTLSEAEFRRIEATLARLAADNAAPASVEASA